MRKQTLIIIGGGIAGLYAARKLAGKFNITLLEAQDRFGGRIHSISGDSGIIEAGAEFVHGNARITKLLLKEAGINTIKTGGHFLQSNNGQWTEDDEQHSQLWEDMLKQLSKAKTSDTLSGVLAKHFPGEALTAFRQRVRSYAEGFDVADPDKAAALALYKEWSQQGDEDHRVEGGYINLVKFLVNDLGNKAEIQLNSSVKKNSVYRSACMR